jgi:hypothetical protein
LEEEGREVMIVLIKKIYQYALSLITLVMMIGGGISVFSNVADLVSPQPYYDTYESYKQMRIVKDPNEPKETEELSEEELQAEYNQMVKTYEENQIKQAKNSLIRSMGWVLVPLPFFLITRRQLKKDKDS